MIVCKRVLGMPGDHVCKDPTAAAPAWVTVPAGHVWLAGDNLTNSRDSRNYGPVAMGLIRGHIVCKIWPQFERLHNNSVPATHLDLERL
ncbi:hypothetical protein HK105_200777 [Polyrhizophydium stewartii]|uniref:Peptidase S26 domain-containing protein n=1 Tax=Polyrhizophydium stewartii TaxID=2732419 RepID=A0ABR4NK55_9FUNG